jgi:CheY-like chemotaxis protein
MTGLNSGHASSAASTTGRIGRQSLRVRLIGTFAAVLLDVSMPGMDGLEVLERVREQQLDIAVIMSTAFGSERVAIDLRRENAALQRQLVHYRVGDCVDPVDLD